ncbi:DUF882 domain-containing protein [Porticoccus sp.]
MVGGFTVGMAVSASSLAKVPAGLPKARSLSFYNLHTGESLETTFCVGKHFLPDSLSEVNRVLRDHRSGEECDISPQLLVLLDNLRKTLGTSQPLQVISGYRSPETNAMLSQHSSGVAKKSLHMQGKAIDIRIPGVELGKLYRAARAMNAGGVGLYSGSDFVHVDVGAVRYWGA